jgi:hypothetical protein
MNITYETNGKAFMGWFEELPGGYVRGKTIDNANENINNEIKEYCQWFGINNKDYSVESWKIINTNAIVEEGDSVIILDAEKNENISNERFELLMEYLMLSAKNLNNLFINSKDVDKYIEKMAGSIFNGADLSTIRNQISHIINAQEYYLFNIGINIKLPNSIINCREEVIKNIIEKKHKERNLIHKVNDGELWNILKVIRRIIWHDRFHANEIKIMNKEMT